MNEKAEVKKIYYTTIELAAEEDIPFTARQLKNILFNREENGCKIAVRKVGGLLYIHKAQFMQWIESQVG